MSITEREFNLQPTPRILPMLGEIKLPEWRCVAELVDNSVDGFLAIRRAGDDISAAQIHVNIPLTDAPSAKLSVRDNGPGMSADTMEKAVTAGWTGNDPINNLGMFGMGFNIATARLGTVTTVWTTRKGDPEWVGLQIDFERLLQQRHFRTPMLTRPEARPQRKRYRSDGRANQAGAAPVLREDREPDQSFARTVPHLQRDASPQRRPDHISPFSQWNDCARPQSLHLGRRG